MTGTEAGNAGELRSVGPGLDDLIRGVLWNPGNQIVVAGDPAVRAAMIERICRRAYRQMMAAIVLPVSDTTPGANIREARAAAGRVGGVSVVSVGALPGSRGTFRFEHLLGPVELEDSDCCVVVEQRGDEWKITVVKNRFGSCETVTFTGVI